MNFPAVSREIGERLESVCPRTWDGRTCLMEMKAGGSRHWRQMEWIGFYFQYLCDTKLGGIMTVPGPQYGRTGFDGISAGIPWDFKAHAINTSSHQLIVNDSEAISKAVGEFGCVGLILALGEVVYNDEARTFQKWHQEFKGGKSAYEHQRIARGAWSRLRKVMFSLKQIVFLQLTDETLVKCGSFQFDFRNSNGKPRRGKVLVDLEKMEDEIMHVLEF